VFVSRHGCSGPYTRIGTAPAESGEFDWNVTGPPSDSVCFKVLVRDSYDNTTWALGATMRAILPATAVAPRSELGAPRLRLAVRGPHPARNRLRLSVELPRESRALIVLHDLQGRRLATIADGMFPAGVSSLDRPLTGLGPRLRAGLYFVSLECEGQRTGTRLVLTD
jgi:hypothetical protein